MKVEARLLIAGLEIIISEAENLKKSLETLLTGEEPDPMPSESINELDDALVAYARLRNDWTEVDDLNVRDMSVDFTANDREYDN